MSTSTMNATAAADYTLQPDANQNDLRHIPGFNGLPFAGRLPWMIKDFNGSIQEHYEKFGEISYMNMGVLGGLLVLGPENYKQVYLDLDRNFSPKMGYMKSLGDFYRRCILLRDFDEHRYQRRVFQAAFKNDAMRGYLHMMNPILKRHIESWEHKRDFHFFEGIKANLLDVAAKVFFGLDDLGDDARKLNQAFIDVAEKGMMGLIKKEIPGLKFYTGKKAKRYMDGYISNLIPARRQGDGIDFMSYVVKEKDENGNYFPDLDLTEHLTFLMFAAHDTTTSALSHLVMLLGQHPEWQERLRKEAMSLDKEFIDYDDMEKLTDMNNAFLEGLRLYPSVSMMTRRTVRPCTLGGIRIPANTVLFLPPHFNHTMKEYWDEPLKFDPDRWAPDRQEQKRHPFQFVGFGGGAHKCIGMHFAQMNAKAFMFQFLRRYRFETSPGYNPWMQIIPMPRPGDMLPLKLTRL
ncbi:MAG TPA: cytochrome P450 [Pseudomonadales bacterium]|nr:cytochrome P450 [Pseudomonadales bacterium]